MKGDQRVIDTLNDLLTSELTGINQYFIHSKMCEDWGYLALAGHVRSESIDEMRHADKVISRILYLEGVPNMQRLGKVNIGETVTEQFRLDLALEQRAIEALNVGLELARGPCQDHGTFELLTQILVDEERHTDWLETQLGLIEKLGEPQYLAQQIRP